MLKVLLLFVLTLLSEGSDTCAAASAQQAHAQQFDSFRLSYFDGRGLAEVPRTLFATAGLFPGSGFDDVRMTRPEFAAAKGKGDLAQNLDRLPVLNHNGAVIGQSGAINRYLARRLGLVGTSEVEAAQVDALTEHIADVRAAYRKLFPYRQELTAAEAEANGKVWFDTPAVPAVEDRSERQLRWFLGHIETTLPGGGYSVGGRPSLADAQFFNLLGEHAPEVEDKMKAEPFGSLARTTDVLSAYPKLKAVVDAFRQSPGMQHYLSVRGDAGKVKW